MRRRQIPFALLLATAYSLTSDAIADGLWQGSYSADGQCFCSGEVPASVASLIVPTPVGGQTVKQVCSRLGEGPGLSVQDGLFNYPVYKDPQCGHGPHTAASLAQDPDCAGSLNGSDKDCQSKGPRWALSQSYGKTPQIAAALPDNPELSRQKEKQIPEVESVSNLSEERATTASQIASSDDQSREEVLAAFSGKSVTLGNERFLQARDDIPTNGGAPGSRIILDGIVYLKDDENMALADLYRNDDKEQQEAKARAQYKIEQEARNARLSREAELADQKRLADKKKLAEDRRLAKDKKLAKEKKLANERKIAKEKRLAKDKKLAKERKLAKEKRLAKDKQLAKQRELAKHKELAKEKKLAKDKKLAAEKKLAEKPMSIEQRKRAAQKRFIEQQKRAREARVASQANRSNENVATVDGVKTTGNTEVQAITSQPSEEKALAAASGQVKTPSEQSSVFADSAVSSALRLPKGVRASSRNFAYIEAMPANYDIGGRGLMLEGSGQSGSRFQYFGKMGVSDTYRELMIGAGFYLTPAQATRMTVVLLAGIENGSFELTDEERAPGRIVTSSDTGVFLGALSRVVINSKFEVKAGIGYSSFFEGDVTLFGGGYIHLTPHLDLMSRFEIGDNDALGLGIRYYY